MNEVALQKEIEKIAKELRFSGEAIESRIIEIEAEIERMRTRIDELVESVKSSFSEVSAGVRQNVTEVTRDEKPRGD